MIYSPQARSSFQARFHLHDFRLDFRLASYQWSWGRCLHAGVVCYDFDFSTAISLVSSCNQQALHLSFSYHRRCRRRDTDFPRLSLSVLGSRFSAWFRRWNWNFLGTTILGWTVPFRRCFCRADRLMQCSFEPRCKSMGRPVSPCPRCQFHCIVERSFRSTDRGLPCWS